MLNNFFFLYAVAAVPLSISLDVSFIEETIGSSPGNESVFGLL